MIETRLPFEAEPENTAMVQVRPDDDPRILALYQEGVVLAQEAAALSVTDLESARTATDSLSMISGLKKAIEEKRKEYVGPLNDHLKAINQAFKDFTEPLNEADTVTRRKVLDYKAEQDRMRQEQERINQLREEAARAEMELKGELTEPVNLVEVMPPPPAQIHSGFGTLGGAKTWKFEVLDFALLPDEYKLPDTTAIRHKVITSKVENPIPGVRAWQEGSLRVTPTQ